MNSQQTPHFTLALSFIALTLAACDDREGVCPEINGVDPAEGTALNFHIYASDPGDDRQSTELVITGEAFAATYGDLLDDGNVQPPDVVYSVDLMPDFELAASQVVFESPERLSVALAGFTLDELEAAGVVIDMTDPEALPSEFNVTLTIINNGGCSTTWTGVFGYEFHL